ncbi:MAG: SDR family oxidoreductase [Prevotellaceae bacterium]|jgi:short-subunit dehydrogenase|nr:SDR family oxidoreductase [Prevotellaceae bacterium]
MSSFQNQNVLITGGASGIGKIMGRLALERGAKLVVWDVDKQGLDDVVAEFSRQGKVCGFQVDVADPEQIRNTAQQVKNRVGTIDILINCAGIIVGKYFHEHSEADIRRTMSIDADAPMFVTRAFIDDMITRNAGHICNIASAAGLISNPKMSVYVAGKWAMVGWSNSLRIEMKQLNKNVKVTTVMPYYINTGMFDGVQSLIPVLKPEKVARKIIGAIEMNRVFLDIPRIYRIIRILQGILPIRAFDWLVGGRLGIYKTMENFTGRK